MQLKKRLITSITLIVILLLGKQVFAEMPNLKLPFEGGISWQVTGDYDISTHKDWGLWADDDYALDFTDTGCGSWNKPALAVAGGEVLTADDVDDTEYGKQVIIDHGDGYRSRYAHLNSVNVQVGEKVVQGQEIGRVGNTGYHLGTICKEHPGTHLHLALYKDGKACKPEPMSGHENFTYGGSYLSDNYLTLLTTFTFPNHSSQGWICGNNTEIAQGADLNTWQTRITGNNPGVESPELQSSLTASDTAILILKSVKNIIYSLLNYISEIVCLADKILN